LNAQTAIFVPSTAYGVAKPLTSAELGHQVRMVLDASIDRADRAAEILDQAGGGGALRYWAAMLRLDPRKEPNTHLLMLVAHRIGEFVAMGLKDKYLMRRPAQLYPRILPLIDGPDTPSYPSSHALQGHLISLVLQAAVTASRETFRSLADLANRVAYNREVAGVHFRMDSEAGAFAAAQCAAKLTASTGGAALIALARAELQNLP
jgi:hypothetical protein